MLLPFVVSIGVMISVIEAMIMPLRMLVMRAPLVSDTISDESVAFLHRAPVLDTEIVLVLRVGRVAIV